MGRPNLLSNKREKRNESGFSLVEILVSLLIFLLVGASVSYLFVQSNAQMVGVEHILNGEQYGMEKSAATANTQSQPTFIVPLGAKEQAIGLPISITLSPAQATQACTPGLFNGIGQLFGSIFNGFACFFGGCQTTPATPSPTSYTISVPLTAITTSDSQIAWWNP